MVLITQISLIEMVEMLIGTGETVGAVVIDEQGPEPNDPKFEMEKALLVWLVGHGCPAYIVEFQPNFSDGNLGPSTRRSIMDIVPRDTPVLIKDTINAFNSTNLHDLLRKRDIGYFVIMGRHTNCCVRMTSLGGAEELWPLNPGGDKPVGTPTLGAVGFGYIVLSADSICREDPAIWKDHMSVMFFERTGVEKRPPTPPPTLSAAPPPRSRS